MLATPSPTGSRFTDGYGGSQSFSRPPIQLPPPLRSPDHPGAAPRLSFHAAELPRLVKLANIAPQVVTPHCLFSAAASSTSAAFYITEWIIYGVNNTHLPARYRYAVTGAPSQGTQSRTCCEYFFLFFFFSPGDP